MRGARDDGSFEAYAQARHTHLRRIAYAMCGDWHRAEDLVQAALVKLYVAWPRVRREGREDAYVRTILLRTHIDEGRRPWRREVSGDVPELPGTGGPEDRPALFEALQTLPLMQRKVVLLRHWL